MGGLKSEKNADSPMRKQLFRKLSFWRLGAPLGSLRLLQTSPGLGALMAPKSCQKRPHNWTKNGSKKGSSFGLLLDPFWGLFWGPKQADKVSLFWHVFRSGSGASFWPHLGLILPPSWPLLGSSWPPLGLSWPYLGLILASSWPSWPLLEPSWPLLGLVLAILAALGPWP